MIKSAGRYGVFIVLFLLAGCFQQAGESLQSTDNTIAPIQQDTPTVAGPTVEITQSFGVASATPRPGSSGPVTATLPPITIIVPPTVVPRLTQITATPNDSEAASDQSAGGPTATTVQFITPGIPLGPNLDTATPITSGGALTATPSGLITPTTLGSGGSIEISGVEVDARCTYTVEPGDTVYRIALSYDTSVAAMKEANPDLEGDNPVIQPGQVLVIPDCDPNKVEPTDTPEPEITATSVPAVIEPAFPSSTVTSIATQAGSIETYVVQPGDTLFIIAQRYGTTVSALVQANDLGDPNRLSIGQELKIPQQP